MNENVPFFDLEIVFNNSLINEVLDFFSIALLVPQNLLNRTFPEKIGMRALKSLCRLF